MADFSCASTKRTSHWPAPMSWEALVRFRVPVVVAALAYRLQRQSGGQSLVADGLRGLRRPLGGPQSLQSHQLRTEQHRARRALSAGNRSHRQRARRGDGGDPARHRGRQVPPRPASRPPALGAGQAHPNNPPSAQGGKRALLGFLLDRPRPGVCLTAKENSGILVPCGELSHTGDTLYCVQSPKRLAIRPNRRPRRRSPPFRL